MRFRIIHQALTAAHFLTRLPLPLVPGGLPKLASCAWAFPLIGAAVGAIGAVIAIVATALGLPPVIAAFLALGGTIISTGALHEDGLADMADGFWGGWTRERRLEIMKDSRIGSYGVIAIALSLALRGAALTTLIGAGSPWALLAIGALSRVPMVVFMAKLPNARGDGLSKSAGQVSVITAFISALLAGAIAAPLGLPALWAILAIGVAMAALARLAHHKIGGQTGDVLGASQQIAEITAMLAIIAAL
jgi:adenosylcobinamide-GDP ribazoletransferase